MHQLADNLVAVIAIAMILVIVAGIIVSKLQDKRARRSPAYQVVSDPFAAYNKRVAAKRR